MMEIKALVDISKYAGERFDLVQAAGGNSSVKLDNEEMLIKASGFLLSDVSESTGYSRVMTRQVANIVRDETITRLKDKREREVATAELLRNATVDKQNRPSIETLLHSLLLKYTLHTHAIVVNMIVLQDGGEDILRDIFKETPFAFVAYETPGIELAIALDKELQKFNSIPNVIFLQNHGLIVTSNDVAEIERLTEFVLENIERYLGIDMARYKLTNAISRLHNRVSGGTNIAYLSEDAFLNEQLHKRSELFRATPFCPDTFVYCSAGAAYVSDLADAKSIEDYNERHHELPKVLLYDNKLFFIAATLKKAKEIEEVLKFHIMTLVYTHSKAINFLPTEELHYLANWEAEKYRQKL